MSVYAESSAVLAWLLGQPGANEIRRALVEADFVCASELTLVECDRAFVRGADLGEITETQSARLADELALASAHWLLLSVGDEVFARARRPFPLEPLRTLDAIHLSSALLVRSARPDISLLALDDRVCRNGEALGFDVIP